MPAYKNYLNHYSLLAQTPDNYGFPDNTGVSLEDEIRAYGSIPSFRAESKVVTPEEIREYESITVATGGKQNLYS